MAEEKEVVSEANGQKEENNDKVEEPSDLETAIIRQVEYYFGDLNIPRDKFMRDQLELDEGWVPLDILLRFNRLNTLTRDPDVVIKALLKATSGLLEVSEEQKKVRRSPEFPIPEMNEERRKEIMDRTVYAKGFDKNATLDDLLKYFKSFEKTENVIMRKYPEKGTRRKLFKGSVFATFQTKEQAEKFLNTKGLKHNDTELITMTQEAYIQSKQEEYLARKDLKDKKSKKKSDKDNEKDEFILPSGTLLHFTNTNKTIKREDIKEALAGLGAEVAYVDFKLGDTQGWVRLSAENTAKGVFEKMSEGKLKIGTAEDNLQFKLIEGDEEKQFLNKIAEEMVKKRKIMKNTKNNKGKHGHFKGRQGRKRKQDDDNDASPKKAKQDS